MPTYQEDRRKKIIRIDGIARDNVGVGIDEKVKIIKVSAKEAKTAVFSALDSGTCFKKKTMNTSLKF